MTIIPSIRHIIFHHPPIPIPPPNRWTRLTINIPNFFLIILIINRFSPIFPNFAIAGTNIMNRVTIRRWFRNFSQFFSDSIFKFLDWA